MNPRRILLALSLAAAAVATLHVPVAHASSSAPVRLRAEVLPTSCDVTFANNGVVDFGVIPAKNLKPNAFYGGMNVLQKSIGLTITCDSAARFAISATDGRKGTAVPGMGAFLFSGFQDDNSTFGVGSVEGKNIGGYVLWRNGSGTADGAAVGFITSADNGGTWTKGTDAGKALIPDARMHAWAPTGTTVPGTYTTLTQAYNITLGLNSRNNLPALTSDTAIDGLATITLHYI